MGPVVTALANVLSPVVGDAGPVARQNSTCVFGSRRSSSPTNPGSSSQAASAATRQGGRGRR